MTYVANSQKHVAWTHHTCTEKFHVSRNKVVWPFKPYTGSNASVEKSFQRYGTMKLTMFWCDHAPCRNLQQRHRAECNKVCVCVVLYSFTSVALPERGLRSGAGQTIHLQQFWTQSVTLPHHCYIVYFHFSNNYTYNNLLMLGSFIMLQSTQLTVSRCIVIDEARDTADVVVGLAHIQERHPIQKRVTSNVKSWGCTSRDSLPLSYR